MTRSALQLAMTLDEQLDDIKRARIWSELEGRIAQRAATPRRSHRALVAGGIAFACAAAAVLAVALWRSNPSPPANTFVVPADATVSAQLGPHTRAAVVGPARLALRRTGDATVVALARGTLLADFAGGSNRTLQIDAPGATIEIVGTLFSVDASATTTCTSVAHGRVKVTATATGKVMFVGGGERYCIDAAIEPIAPAALEALERHERTITALAAPPSTADVPPPPATATTASPATTSTNPVPSATKRSAQASATSADVTPATKSPARATTSTTNASASTSAPDANASTSAPDANASTSATTDIAAASPSTSATTTPANTTPAHATATSATTMPANTSPAPAHATTTSATTNPATTNPANTTPAPATAARTTPATASELYRTADTALAARDAGAADRALAALVSTYPDSPLVEQALFDRARIAHQRKAWKAAREHLAGLTRGLLAEPSHWLRCRIEIDAGESGAARTCLLSYRRAFVRSPHDLDALALLARLAHATGGCRAAAADVDELASRYPRTSLAASWRARCPERGAR